MSFGKKSIHVASKNHMLKMDFIGSNDVAPKEKSLNNVENASNSGEKIKELDTVIYSELWNGVMVKYEKNKNSILKSTYTIKERSKDNPVKSIRLKYNRPVRLDKQGNLIASYDTGEVSESAPIAWQDINGKRNAVKVAYNINKENEINFKVEEYNPNYELVIDPTLMWHTFLGASWCDDTARTLAVDTSGNVYIGGYGVGSWGSPVRAYHGSSVDTFVAKLDTNGNLIWNTFLGGCGEDYGRGIGVDTSGNVYVCGETSATWGSPVRAFVRSIDSFVVKLDTNGNLIWNTFLGGYDGFDYCFGISADTNGNVYVSGQSGATWGTPVRAYTGVNDAFVAKLDNNGNLTWNTFLGGSGNDSGWGNAVDASGNVYVSGTSKATWGSPIIVYSGADDAFVAKLDSNGNLTWNTFLGSWNANDACYSLAIDSEINPNIYVSGVSAATWGSPVRAYTSGNDGFIAKLNNSGSLIWNTFLGGSGVDSMPGIVTDSSGNIYIGGYSTTTWGSPSRAYTSGYDATAAKLDNNGNLLWNTFLGGSGDDSGGDIAVDSNKNVYIAGESNATWGSSPIRAYAGLMDAFVAKIPEIPLLVSLKSFTKKIKDSSMALEWVSF